MKNEEPLAELEQLVAAMEESLAIIAGTISETSDPRQALMHLCAATAAFEKQHGPNGWRDRLLRSALKTCALKARPQSSADPKLQALIAKVLGSWTESPGFRTKSDSMH